jgi:mRNA export factor
MNSLFQQPNQTQNQTTQPYVHNNDSENPKDTPQCIKFSPSQQNIFAVSSWDQTLRIYEINQQYNSLSQKACINLPHYPLAMDFKPDGNGIFVSCGDMSVYSVDFNTMSPQKIFSSPSQILFLCVFGKQNLFLTINEANQINFYSVNSPAASIYSLQLNFQVTAMDSSENIVLLGLVDNKFTFLDMNSINFYSPNDLVYNESQLKSPISAVAVNFECKEFTIGSCDGRVYKGVFSQVNQNSNFNQGGKVIYSSFHNPSDTSGNFVYVAHSKKRNDNTSDLYNISGMGFNKRSRNFLYSTGGDGVLNYWDIKEKNKIVTHNLGSPINCASINSFGSILAFGIGYDWSQGVWGLPQVNYSPKIGFRIVGDNELVFKSQAMTTNLNPNQTSLQLPNSFNNSFTR